MKSPAFFENPFFVTPFSNNNNKNLPNGNHIGENEFKSLMNNNSHLANLILILLDVPTKVYVSKFVNDKKKLLLKFQIKFIEQLTTI